MGIGSARGEDRAIQAAETAISSPLLEASVDGAHGVLLSIQGGSDLGLFEINEAARLVQEAAHPEANIIFGAVIDDALGDEVRVTVIAAGFDGGAPARRRDERALGQVSGRTVTQPAAPASAPVAPAQQRMPQPAPEPVGVGAPAHSTVPTASAPAPQLRPQPLDADLDRPVVVERPAPVQEPVAAPRLVELPAEPPRATRPPRPVTLEEDDLDVPDFLK
jgi:cell division protein FtsZ